MDLIAHPESNSLFAGTFDESMADAGAHTVDASQLTQGTRIAVAFSESVVRPCMDFETYSEAGFTIDPVTGKVRGTGSQGKGGLGVVGTPAYAEHPSTEVLCLYYNLKDGRGVRGWIPGSPLPVDLLNHIANGGEISAFNFTFEWYIWNMVCTRRYGFPPMQLEQGHCSMAKARRYSLPGKLATLAKVLGTPQKDQDGGRLLNKLSRPVSATSKRKQPRWTIATAYDDYMRLFSYCHDDTVAEDGATALIPELTEQERAVWLLDQRINARGVQVDTEALACCLKLLETMHDAYTIQLVKITQGRVGSVSETAKFLEWLASCGAHLPDLRAETVTEWLESDRLPQDARAALQIRAILGGANVKKLPTLMRQVSSDGRLRDQYMYCGADRTGRFSAGGVQLQNLTAKGPKTKSCNNCGRAVHIDFNGIGPVGGCPACGDINFTKNEEWTVDAVEDALHDIKTCSLQDIVTIWGNPAEMLAGCLRGLFVAKQGHDLICADFSAIEAVAAACLARCQWRIDTFAAGECIYTSSASKITGTPLEVYKRYKAENGGHHPDRKKIGKIAELASGYGGWVGAWKNFGADKVMEDDEIKANVLRWREESPEIVEMWGGQFRWCGPGKWDYRPELFGLEGAFIAAVLNPGQAYHVNDIAYLYRKEEDVLFCRLPSGRMLHYHRPRLLEGSDKLKRGPSYKLTFEGYNSNPTKGPVGWVRMETYGGSLFENVVQAVSADIQTEAMLRVERAGYTIVMHTHDEVCTEVPEAFGSVEELCSIMSQRPSWAQWWPIRAAGWRHKRYQKD